MSDICHSTLKVYGNAAFSESIRRIVDAVFGSRLSYNENHSTDTGSGSSPVALVRIESTEEPPTELIRELSEKLPELSFVLMYTIPSRGSRGSFVFKGGQAEDGGDESCGGKSIGQETVEAAFRDSDHRTSAVVTRETTCTKSPSEACPRSLRERAQEYLDCHFDLLVDDISGKRRVDNFEYVAIDVWSDYMMIRALLSQDGKQCLDERCNERGARVDSLRSQATAEKAADFLRAGLRYFDVPVVAKFLEADDRAALMRLTETCQKVGPECYEPLAQMNPEIEPF